MTRRSPALLLRLWIPLLVAVAVLLGPGLARAGGPAPDPPSGGATGFFARATCLRTGAATVFVG